MSILSEVDIDARLQHIQAQPNEHQLAGGANFLTAFSLLVCSVIGTIASIGLIDAEKQKLAHPGTALLCDVNPLIGCGKWIGTWQNEVLFGVTNAVWGLAFFAGIAALALALLAKACFASWLWRLLSIGVTLGIVWIVWFQYESYFVAGSLCPYCVVTWFVTIPLFVGIWARALQAKHWGESASAFGRMLVRNRYLIVAVWYVVLVTFTIIKFWNLWLLFL